MHALSRKECFLDVLHSATGFLRGYHGVQLAAGNLRQRARVDAAMDWHHWTARRGAAGQVCSKAYYML